MSDGEARGRSSRRVHQAARLGLRRPCRTLAEKQETTEVEGPSGTTYHVELQGFWDDGEHRELRVIASIDDGGLRAFLPFTDSFTIEPSGTITEHSAA